MSTPTRVRPAVAATPPAPGAPSPAAGLPVPELLPLLALASGVAVAGNYALQPLLAQVGADLGVGIGAVGLVVSLALLGYATGLLLVVPLGDVVDRRPLVLGCLTLTTAGLAAGALAPTVRVLAAAALVVGLTSVVAQVLVPYAATLADDLSRGRVVGTMMSGILAGILGARVVAGLLGGQLGWRAVLAAAAGLTGSLLVLLARRLPAEPHRRRRNGRPDVPYREVLAGVARLAATEPRLRLRALYGACGFGVFSALWTALAFHLHDAFGLGPSAVAAVAVLGVAGVLAAPRAGRLADRGHITTVTGAAYALLLAGAGVLALGGGNLPLLLVGIVLCDVAVQVGHVANLGVVYALAPDARSRVTTVYMTAVFVGGAAGSVLSARAYAGAGWGGVAAVCAALAATALLTWLLRLPVAPPDAFDEPYPEAIA